MLMLLLCTGKPPTHKAGTAGAGDTATAKTPRAAFRSRTPRANRNRSGTEGDLEAGGGVESRGPAIGVHDFTAPLLERERNVKAIQSQRSRMSFSGPSGGGPPSKDDDDDDGNRRGGGASGGSAMLPLAVQGSSALLGMLILCAFEPLCVTHRVCGAGIGGDAEDPSLPRSEHLDIVLPSLLVLLLIVAPWGYTAASVQSKALLSLFALVALGLSIALFVACGEAFEAADRSW